MNVKDRLVITDEELERADLQILLNWLPKQVSNDHRRMGDVAAAYVEHPGYLVETVQEDRATALLGNGLAQPSKLVGT